MKKVIYLLSFLFVFSLNAQKNKNGVIYDKHPGIDLITAFLNHLLGNSWSL